MRTMRGLAVAIALTLTLGAPPARGAWDSPVALSTGEAMTSYAYSNPAPGVWLKLDLYRPAEPNGAAVMFVHGGSWQYGDRRHGRWLAPLTEALLARGYAVASIDYRLAPTWTWSAQIADAKAAVRYLRDRLGYERIAAVGESAGGQLVALLGTADTPKLAAVVNLYGPTLLTRWSKGYELTNARRVFADSAALLRAASPVSYATDDDPPMLLVTGTEDPITPPEQMTELGSRLPHASVVIVEGAGHGLEGFDVVATTLDFLGRQLP